MLEMRDILERDIREIVDPLEGHGTPQRALGPGEGVALPGNRPDALELHLRAIQNVHHLLL